MTVASMFPPPPAIPAGVLVLGENWGFLCKMGGFTFSAGGAAAAAAAGAAGEDAMPSGAAAGSVFPSAPPWVRAGQEELRGSSDGRREAEGGEGTPPSRRSGFFGSVGLEGP